MPVPVSKNLAWVELIQLAPVVSLALPFIISGQVDLGRASFGFLLGAALAVVISGWLIRRKYLLNPILVGTNLWLCVGAVAFNLRLAALSSWLTAVQGAGLFVMVLAVGAVTTLGSTYGFIGCAHPDAAWIRRASWVLLTLTAAAAIGAYVMRHNVRLGGGVPFILLNVIRRVMVVRGLRRAAWISSD